MRLRDAQAFTLVEMVIVIAIIGILAAIAIPRFIDIRNEAYLSQRDGIIGAVRAGILTVAAKNQVNQLAGTFPPNLEVLWNGITGGTASVGSGCLAATPCFELVIPGGYIDSHWVQSAAAVYTWDNPYNGPGVDTTCTYDTTVGTFLCP